MRNQLLRDLIPHHLSKLLEVDAPIAVRINGRDHPRAILNGALLSQLLEHQVQLGGRNQTVLVQIVHLESLFEILDTFILSVRSLAAAVEIGKFLEVDESVAIGVELGHHAAEIVGGRGGAEGGEDVAELGEGDLAVAVGVEALEDLNDIVRVERGRREVRIGRILTRGHGSRDGRKGNFGVLHSCEMLFVFGLGWRSFIAQTSKTDERGLHAHF